MNRPVLVVDDNLDNRVLLARILRHFGEQPVCADSGKDALEYLRTHRPRLVLLDLLMPELDGLSVLRSIRDTPGLEDLPVVVFSAAAEHDFRAAREGGATDCLVKGVATLDDIRSRLAEFGEVV